jgi:hypothetical protein
MPPSHYKWKKIFTSGDAATAFAIPHGSATEAIYTGSPSLAVMAECFPCRGQPMSEILAAKVIHHFEKPDGELSICLPELLDQPTRGGVNRRRSDRYLTPNLNVPRLLWH